MLFSLKSKVAHFEGVKFVFGAGVVVDSSLVAVEVVVHHVGNRQGPVLHQGLQHQLFITGAVVPAQILVVAHVGAAAAGVSIACVVLGETVKID